MAVLNFAEYRPDVGAVDSQFTRSLLDVLPRSDGYGPIRDIAALTSALPAQCRGYFYARETDGSVAIFAGTATKLYKLNNTTFAWADVSKSAGVYTDVDTDAQWSFAQFGLIVIACQKNDNVQAYTLGSSSAFDDLGGSPPDAAFVTVVGQFVVLAGLTSNPFRVHWSAIGSAIGWTAGTDQSDYQDLSDGGIVRRVMGGDIGIICQDQAFRRMVFSPGSDVIFVIEKIAQDIGILHPYAATVAGEKIFVLTAKGFVQMDASGGMTPIGFEKVDRTFFETYDTDAPQFVQMAADPKSHTVLCTYRTSGMQASAFDAALAYNWALQLWSLLSLAGEYIATLSQPGLTIEGLDAIAPGALEVAGAADNGGGLIRIEVADTSGLATDEYKTISAVTGTTEANGTWQIEVIDGTTFDLIEDEAGNASAFSNAYVSGGVVGGSTDEMETSWDAIAVATLPNLSLANASHKVGFLNGDNKEAILETPEQSGDGQRIQVNGFWPITDAPTAFGSISKRENLSASLSYTNESSMKANGFVGLIRDTRYSRAKLRIPSGTAWTYAKGIRPEIVPGGEI